MNKRRRTLILDTDPETLITLQQVFATTENSFRELIEKRRARTRRLAAKSRR